MEAVPEELDELEPSNPQPTLWGRSREHWFVLGLALLSVLGLVVLSLFLSPDERGVGTHEQLGMRACMTMDQFDFPCPGCGVTTSVTLAAQGEFLSSIANQPFGFVTFLLIVGFVLWSVFGQLTGRDLYRDLKSLAVPRWGTLLAVVVAVSWVYKIFQVRG